MRATAFMVSTLLGMTITAMGVSPAHAADVDVRPNGLSGWSVVTNASEDSPYDASNLNTDSTATFTFDDGPGTPPIGEGSLTMSAGSEPNSRVAANIPNLPGTTLDSVSALAYSTYLTNGTAPTNLKIAGTTTLLGFATLVFEPAKQATAPAPSTWQAWDASAGVWWTSKVASGDCSQAQPCSWADMLAAVGADTPISQAYFELGDSGTGFTDVICALDKAIINGNVYNFEVASPTGQPEQEQITPGQEQTIVASGFAPSEPVTVTLDGVTVGTYTADASGTVTITFKVPASLPPGQYSVVLTGQQSGRTTTVSFQVVTSLPLSGESVTPIALAGLLVIALGAGLTMVTRRQVAIH